MEEIVTPKFSNLMKTINPQNPKHKNIKKTLPEKNKDNFHIILQLLKISYSEIS